MVIRNAQPEDIPAVAALEDAIFSDPWPADMLMRLRDKITVAEDDDGTLAGYIVFSAVLDEGSVDNIAAAPAYRRRGVADALLGDALAKSRALGLAVVLLEVRASNAPAVALYEKHGFAAVGRRRGYYTNPREDAILMTLVL